MKRLGVLESAGGIGGAEVNVLRLAEPLSERSWEPIFFVPARGSLTETLEKRGIAWRLVPSPAAKSTSRYLGRIKVADPFAIAYDVGLILRQARDLARMLRKDRIELLHTNSMLAHLVGGFAAKLAGIPCIWHLQDIVDPNAAFGIFRRVLDWGAHSLASRVICCSGAVAEQIASQAARRRTVVVYNGVDTVQYNPSGPVPFREKWADSREELVIGQVGRFTPWKGQELLVEVAARAVHEGLNVRFVLIGDDAFGQPGYGNFLRAKALRLGLDGRLIFAGWVDDVPGALRSIDLLVHPSLLPEPFPLAPLEALACGRPIVIAAHPSAHELVLRGQAGLLFRPGDAQACLDAVRCLVQNRRLAAQLAETGRKRVEDEFSLDRFADGMAQVYNSTVSSGATL